MNYTIESQANGEFVTLRHVDGRSVFLQGPDAHRFLREIGFDRMRKDRQGAIEAVCDEYMDAVGVADEAMGRPV